MNNMKQFFFFLLSFSLLCATANASPAFTSGKKYRIASLDVSGNGELVIRSTPNGLKLVYEENTAAFGDSASWYFYEADGKYSFKNVATKKYIKLHPSESGIGLEMVVPGAFLDTSLAATRRTRGYGHRLLRLCPGNLYHQGWQQNRKGDQAIII